MKISQSIGWACAAVCDAPAAAQAAMVAQIEDAIEAWVKCPCESSTIDRMLDDVQICPFDGSSIKCAKDWMAAGRPRQTRDEIVAEIEKKSSAFAAKPKKGTFADWGGSNIFCSMNDDD